MSDARTEREALLEARVKELEDAARASVVSVAQGGIFEGIWRAINKIVPPWLAIAALAAFLGYHGYEYDIAAQITAADTQLKNAKAAVDGAEAAAQNQTVNDVPMRLATARAQLANTQAEASRAKAEADAKTAQVNDETLALATAKAQLANTLAEASRAKAEAAAKTAQVDGESMSLAQAKADLANTQNQAALVRAQADAASAQFGLQTLQQRLVRANLIIQQLQVIENRVSAANTNSVSNLGRAGGMESMYAETVRAECENNQFAKFIGCPAQYVRQAAQEQLAQLQPQVQQPQSASPGAGQLRTPANFNCAKATMGTDYVICSSRILLDAEARLEDAYQAAHTAGGDNVRSAQYAWIRSYGPNCGLPFRGRPAPNLIEGSRQCVFDAITKRIGDLQAGH